MFSSSLHFSWQTTLSTCYCHVFISSWWSDVPSLRNNRNQMASAFSEYLIFNRFYISSTLGCISLGYFLILWIVKIIFWELWHHRKTEKFSGNLWSLLTFFRINRLYMCLSLLKGWVGRGQPPFIYSSVCTSYSLRYGALWFLMFFQSLGF